MKKLLFFLLMFYLSGIQAQSLYSIRSFAVYDAAPGQLNMGLSVLRGLHGNVSYSWEKFAVLCQYHHRAGERKYKTYFILTPTGYELVNRNAFDFEAGASYRTKYIHNNKVSFQLPLLMGFGSHMESRQFQKPGSETILLNSTFKKMVFQPTYFYTYKLYQFSLGISNVFVHFNKIGFSDGTEHINIEGRNLFTQALFFGHSIGNQRIRGIFQCGFSFNKVHNPFPFNTQKYIKWAYLVLGLVQSL